MATARQGRARQKLLFDENAECNADSSGLVAEVVFNRPMRSAYSYRIPADLAASLTPGLRVLAPLGRGSHRTLGYCVAVRPAADEENASLKPVLAIVDETPLVSPAMLELTRWIGERYFCAWGQVLDAVLPRAVKDRSGGRWQLLLQPVAEESRPSEKLPIKQQRAFQTLLEIGRPVPMKELGERARCGPACLKELLNKGFVTMIRRRVFPHAPTLRPVDPAAPIALNPHQSAALDRIEHALNTGDGRVFLLHGVTGSGKTEVYLRAIARVIAEGKQAIVLVPEISLTPQTTERFRQRFDEVAVLHSHLSDVERHWHWRRIAQGEAPVVIGARSALFAPCPRLGLIVIDEEHETTYKQDSVPRYHAREVAVRRGKMEGASVILGSATPSLESWRSADAGEYELLSLPTRVANRPMPAVTMIDLKTEYDPKHGLRALSRPLSRAMEAAVANGGQVLLLLNRRGFATSLMCPVCGKTAMCKHCEVTLTYHKHLNRLLCHACDADYAPPERCSQCNMPAIRYAGIGVERLEAEIRGRFPHLRCQRMDSDTMRSARHYEEVLDAFRRGEVDVLMGTQMIAKGLDFPNVRLVGVVSADTGRNLPDFRAAERTFQLIAQVAGRTGRGDEPGTVLVQTFNPDDPALLAACKHDYAAFIGQELPIRREFGYPPFGALARVVVRAAKEERAWEAARVLADRLRTLLPTDGSIRVLGPAAAPVGKIRDLFRVHFQLHAVAAEVIVELLEKGLADAAAGSDIEWMVDIDPHHLL